jgi:hypothetical protein
LLTIPDIYRRVAMTKQERIAEAIEKSPSQVNRIVSMQAGLMIEDSPKFFGAIGCDIVEVNDEMITVPRTEYEALRTLARKALG